MTSGAGRDDVVSRLRIGDRVYIKGMPTMPLEVIDVSNPGLVVLRAPNCATLKAGRKTVIRAEETEQAIRRPPMAERESKI